MRGLFLFSQLSVFIVLSNLKPKKHQNEEGRKLSLAYFIFVNRLSFLRNSQKKWKLAIFAYDSIASHINGISGEINISRWRSTLNLDFVFWDFFQKPYFAFKFRISIRDWSKFYVIFLYLYVTQINVICGAIMRFGGKLRKQSLDNLSLFNILKVVWPYLICGTSLFCKTQDMYIKK